MVNTSILVGIALVTGVVIKYKTTKKKSKTAKNQS